MIPSNPHFVRHLMADRERESEKLRLIREIRQARRVAAPTAPRLRWRPAVAMALLLGLLVASAILVHLEIAPLNWTRYWR